jgi:hypothetical protein
MRHLTLTIVAKTLFGTELAGEADVVGESVEIVTNHFMSPTPELRFGLVIHSTCGSRPTVTIPHKRPTRSLKPSPTRRPIESRRIPVPANELSPSATVCLVRLDHLARFVDQAR